MKRGVRTKPLIIAHRGLHDHHPENSLSSLQAAEHAGVPAAEFDIRQTLDKRFVLNHDPIFPGMKRPIAECALAELQQTVPSLTLLDDVLTATNPPFHLCIEVTDEIIDAGQLKTLLQKMNAVQRSTILSFSPVILKQAALQDISRWLLIDIPGGKHFLPAVFRDPIAFSLNLKVPTVAPHYSLVDLVFMQKVREHNLLVIPWTVNDGQHAKELLELGVDGLITDIPTRLQEIL